MIKFHQIQKTLGDFFSSILPLVDKVTQYRCLWEVTEMRESWPGHHDHKNREDQNQIRRQTNSLNRSNYWKKIGKEDRVGSKQLRD